MNKVIVLTLMVLMVMASSAMAMLKVLEPALASELEGLVREQIAAERKINIDKVVIEEGWVLELHSLKTDLYVVIATVDGTKVETHVHVGEKRVLTQEAAAAMIAEDARAAASDPQMRITNFAATTDKALAEVAPVDDRRPWYIAAGGIGAVTLLGVGALAVLRKR